MCFATKPTISVLLAAGWSVLGTSAHADILHVPGDFPTIQAAIDAAIDGDEVEVHPGTYNENINLLGKAITVRSTDPTDPTVVVSTIIDGGGSGSVVTCNSGEGADTVFSGFIVTDGNADDGGGMNNVNSGPTVSNCTFSGNTASFGGGMANFGSGDPTVTNCTFSNNTAGTDGGGMYNNSSSPTVSNCTFSNNTADTNAGGMYNDGNPTLSNCTFSNNTAEFGKGGGMFNPKSPTLTNCQMCGNTPDPINGPYTDGGGNVILTGPYCPPPTALCLADLDGNGTVGPFDLALLLGNWGSCP